MGKRQQKRTRSRRRAATWAVLDEAASIPDDLLLVICEGCQRIQVWKRGPCACRHLYCHTVTG